MKLGLWLDEKGVAFRSESTAPFIVAGQQREPDQKMGNCGQPSCRSAGRPRQLGDRHWLLCQDIENMMADRRLDRRSGGAKAQTNGRMRSGVTDGGMLLIAFQCSFGLVADLVEIH